MLVQHAIFKKSYPNQYSIGSTWQRVLLIVKTVHEDAILAEVKIKFVMIVNVN